MNKGDIYVGRHIDQDSVVHAKYIKKVPGKNGKWRYIYDTKELKNYAKETAKSAGRLAVVYTKYKLNSYSPGAGTAAVEEGRKLVKKGQQSIAKERKRIKQVAASGKGDYATNKYGAAPPKKKSLHEQNASYRRVKAATSVKGDYATRKYGTLTPEAKKRVSASVKDKKQVSAASQKPDKSLERRRKEIALTTKGAHEEQQKRDKKLHEQLHSTTEAAKRARANVVERAKMSAKKTSRKIGIAQRRELKTAKINQESNDVQLQYRKVGDQGEYRDSRGRIVMAKDGKHMATTTLVSKEQSQRRVDAAQRLYDNTTLGKAEKRIRSIGKKKRKRS